MAVRSSFFEIFGRLLSREQIRGISKHLSAAGIEYSAEAFAGYFVLNVVILTLLLAFSIWYVPSLNKLVFGLVLVVLPTAYAEVVAIMSVMLAVFVVFFVLFFVLSSVLIVMTEARRKALEAALPDFLMLVAANIRAGMPLDQAMWYSAKPDFGLISTEIKSIIKKSFSGSSLSSVLDELSERFDSKVFARTVSLIKQSSNTGGELSEILERTSQDARNALLMKKEISASLVLYEIFVFFSAAIGTPFLFSVSSKLIGVLEKAFTYLPATKTSVQQFSFFKPVAPLVTSTEFYYFTLAALLVTAIFSSFIIGVIRTGSKNEGIKFLPFVAVSAFIVYFIVSTLLDTFFSSIS